jgi:hypothetical protein
MTWAEQPAAARSTMALHPANDKHGRIGSMHSFFVLSAAHMSMVWPTSAHQSVGPYQVQRRQAHLEGAGIAYTARNIVDERVSPAHFRLVRCTVPAAAVQRDPPPGD